MASNRTVADVHPCYESRGDALVFAAEPSAACALLYALLGALSAVTVCGNLLVVASVMYFKQLRSATNCLVLSLAAADLLVGVVVFPLSMIFTVTWCWHADGAPCKARGAFDVTLSTASILNLCCISVDRYYAVCRPLLYGAKMTGRAVGAMVLASWGVAALIGMGVTAAGFNQGKCEDGGCMADALISTTLACLFSFYVPVVVMLCIYLKILLAALRQVASIQNAKSGAAGAKTERKATRTLATVMGVFLLCWTPYFLCIVFQPLAADSTPAAAVETLNWLTLVNSTLNPFIYAVFYRSFRSAFRLIVSGKIFRGNLSNCKLI